MTFTQFNEFYLHSSGWIPKFRHLVYMSREFISPEFRYRVNKTVHHGTITLLKKDVIR